MNRRTASTLAHRPAAPPPRSPGHTNSPPPSRTTSTPPRHPAARLVPLAPHLHTHPSPHPTRPCPSRAASTRPHLFVVRPHRLIPLAWRDVADVARVHDKEQEDEKREANHGHAGQNK
eukprot:359032-Chlamydomonas_euryale.AAC.2